MRAGEETIADNEWGITRGRESRCSCWRRVVVTRYEGGKIVVWFETQRDALDLG